jgi:hypothetical protein
MGDFNNLNKEEMKKYIVSVLSEMHDYIPNTNEIKDNKNIIGCLNTYYHNGNGKSLVYPPITEPNGVSIVTPTVAYVLTNNEEIYVITENLDCINLDDCLGNSYLLVFAMIRDVYVNELI